MSKIYQTASLRKKTYHIGKIKSKCYETRECTKEQLQAVTNILFQQGEKYLTRIKNLHNSEKTKSYSDRYPTNSDSIGIEIVGNYDQNTDSYESVNLLQNQSLQWLISKLFEVFSIAAADFYKHPEISYKKSSEASTATW